MERAVCYGDLPNRLDRDSSVTRRNERGGGIGPATEEIRLGLTHARERTDEPLQPNGQRLFSFMATFELRNRDGANGGPASRDAVGAADLSSWPDTVRDPSVAGASRADAAGGRHLSCRLGGRRLHRSGRTLGFEQAPESRYVDIEWRARFDDLVAGRPLRRAVIPPEGMTRDLADS